MAKRVLDFYANWCGPCKMMKPTISDLKNEFPETFFKEIDVDEDPQATQHFDVMSIPTLIIMEEAEEVKRFTGVHAKEEIAKFLR